MLTGTPVILLKEGTERATGVDALHENIAAARAVAESLRSTLGPRGLDKMMISSTGDVVITNDGATILKTIEIQNPASKMLAEVAKAQDQECGDGTKSSVILTGELLKHAEELLDEKVHPTRIVEGFRIAEARAVRTLDALARPVGRGDSELLRRIAMTAMMSKGISGDRAFLADLAVRAVDAVAEDRGDGIVVDEKQVQVVKRPGGRVADSELVYGHVVEHERARPDMPAQVRDARIALLEAPLEVKKPEFSSEIRISDPAKIQAFLDEEARILVAMVGSVRAAGANVLFVEKGIDDVAAEALARAGIYAVARVARSDLELLARATGARLGDRAGGLEASDLGSARLVEERTVGEGRLTIVSGAPAARSVTLLLRGGTVHVVDEAARSLEDAVDTVALALEDGRAITGAGAAAMELAKDLRAFASSVPGREQMAVRAFADALEELPTTLAENAGMGTIDSLLELRQRHALGEVDAGVDVAGRRIGNMREEAVEPIRVGRQVLHGATETAAMLLRIDDVIAAHASASPGAASAPVPAGG